MCPASYSEFSFLVHMRCVVYKNNPIFNYSLYHQGETNIFLTELC